MNSREKIIIVIGITLSLFIIYGCVIEYKQTIRIEKKLKEKKDSINNKIEKTWKQKSEETD